jgi:hypothetical protein
MPAKRIIFYSWQSDLPNATNRGFIQSALDLAAEKIATDNSVEVGPVIDRDTQGVAGSPDITATIFAKIATADVFVADVSIIFKSRKGRLAPNPNVLIELGYALRAHGSDKILMVFNEAYGKISDLPFDLKMRRIIPHKEAEKNADRATEIKVLAATLEAALRTALSSGAEVAEPNTTAPAISAIENGEPKRKPLMKRALADALSSLDARRPKTPREGGTIEDLLTAINESQEAIADVAKLSEAISIMSDEESALELYRWFGAIFERCDLPRNFTGSFNNADFDYFKFIGYEIFTNLISILLRDRKLNILQCLFGEPILIEYMRSNSGPGSTYWNRLSAFPPMLVGYGEANSRLSYIADLVNERHTSGALTALVPFDDFLEADYFLYLRSLGGDPSNRDHIWRPWCVPYLEHVPMFIRSAQRKPEAMQLATTLAAGNIENLKSLIMGAPPLLQQMFIRGFLRLPMNRGDIDAIGSVE